MASVCWACHLFQTWAQLQKFRFATCLMLGGLYMVLRPIELQSNHFKNCTGMFSKVYHDLWYVLHIATVLTSRFFHNFGLRQSLGLYDHISRGQNVCEHFASCVVLVLCWSIKARIYGVEKLELWENYLEIEINI